MYILKVRNSLFIFIPGEKERCFLFKMDRIALRYVSFEPFLNWNILFKYSVALIYYSFSHYTSVHSATRLLLFLTVFKNNVNKIVNILRL
jgi:hypothetical protein